MKKLLLLVLPFSGIEKANAFNSGLNIELVYIYGLFILGVLFLVGIDKLIQYVWRKLKERQNRNEQEDIPTILDK